MQNKCITTNYIMFYKPCLYFINIKAMTFEIFIELTKYNAAKICYFNGNQISQCDYNTHNNSHNVNLTLKSNLMPYT